MFRICALHRRPVSSDIQLFPVFPFKRQEMLYFGPETYLPLASFIAAGIGGLLTFWRRIVGFIRRFFTKMSDRRRARRILPPG